jgi:hypothetical protein
MSDNSYNSNQQKFQELDYHLKRLSDYIEQMEIALILARRTFNRLTNLHDAK